MAERTFRSIQAIRREFYPDWKPPRTRQQREAEEALKQLGIAPPGPDPEEATND